MRLDQPAQALGAGNLRQPHALSLNGAETGQKAMSETVLNVLQYYGAVVATLAALVVALDLGRRITGWAFVLFVTSSFAFIGWGFLNPDSEGIGWQNIALLLINGTGVYRYLIRRPRAGERGSASDRPAFRV